MVAESKPNKLTNVRCKTSRTLRKKKGERNILQRKLMSLKQTIKTKVSETCILTYLLHGAEQNLKS
jgi:hypothetical protein